MMPPATGSRVGEDKKVGEAKAGDEVCNGLSDVKGKDKMGMSLLKRNETERKDVLSGDRQTKTGVAGNAVPAVDGCAHVLLRR